MESFREEKTFELSLEIKVEICQGETGRDLCKRMKT